jgi:hypothetical protein
LLLKVVQSALRLGAKDAFGLFEYKGNCAEVLMIVRQMWLFRQHLQKREALAPSVAADYIGVSAGIV